MKKLRFPMGIPLASRKVDDLRALGFPETAVLLRQQTAKASSAVARGIGGAVCVNAC